MLESVTFAIVPAAGTQQNKKTQQPKEKPKPTYTEFAIPESQYVKPVTLEKFIQKEERIAWRKKHI